MKEEKNFLIKDFIVILVLLLTFILFKSYSILAFLIYQLFISIISLLSKFKKEKKYKGIISLVISFIMLLLTVSSFLIILKQPIKYSLLNIIFILLLFIVKYITTCFYIIKGRNNQEGLIGYANTISNLDLIMCLICIIVPIISIFSKYLNILKYSEYIGYTLISLFTIYKCLKIFKNSILFLEDKTIEIDKFLEEVNNRKEVNKIEHYKIINYGGISKLSLNISFQNNINLTDFVSIVIMIEDYLLKKYDIVIIKNINQDMKRVNKNARNSGSRDSKKHPKAKNTKKKNKKR